MLAVSLLLPFAAALGTESNFSRRTETLRPQVLKPLEPLDGESKVLAKGTVVQLAQLHGRAAVPRGVCEEQLPDEERRHQEFDELTVEWKSNERVASVIVRLPERQECADGICTGYEFWSFDKEGTCKILKPKSPAGQKTDHQAIRLPSDPDYSSLDMSLQTGLRCEVIKNEREDGSPQPHRSAMVELFTPSSDEPQTGEQWHHFTVLIRNPQLTPEGSDIAHHTANSFQVILRNAEQKELAVMSFEAKQIQPAWVCGYSEWITSTPCTAQCGGGKRVSTRRLLHAPPPGMDPRRKVCCHAALYKEETCNTVPCDLPCVLSDWTRWNHKDGECSRKCGGGELTERRMVIMNAKGNGDICPHFSAEERVRTTPCALKPCAARCIKEGAILADGTGTSADADKHATEEAKESFLAIGMDAKLVERPRVEKGKAKGVCSKPCGGGKRKVIIPSAKKDIALESRPEKTCHDEIEEDCNMFACKPLMFLPAQPWSYPVRGEWYLVDIVFVLEELAESLAIRAPPDFYLAASGDENECFLAEHTIPVLDSCTISPGQVESRTGPIMLLKFTHPLEPQNPLSSQRDYYHLRTWVQHPEACESGTHGECRGKPEPEEREWTLLISSQQPHPLWEVTKGSYAYYQNVGFAEKAFKAQQDQDLPYPGEAERVIDARVARDLISPAGVDDASHSFMQTDEKVKTEEKADKIDLVSLPGGKLQKVKKAKF